MRIFARCSLTLTILALSAGPVLAAPRGLSYRTAMGAPAPRGATPLTDVLGWMLSGGAVFGITIKKDIGSIAAKFVTRAQAAAPDYKTGVAQAGASWEAATAAAEPAYDAGVQQAITSKRFGKGVQGKGGKFQTNAVNLGSQRYGPGVANAQAAYQAGMAPVLQTLQGINLPAKSFRGSPGNQARANAVSTALAAMRSNK